MKLSVKDILIFCIDRGLRQFHYPYRWFITSDANAINEDARESVKKKNPNFFSENNYFIVLKVPKMNGESAEAERIKGISECMAKSLIGGMPTGDVAFVQKIDESKLIVGLNIT